MTRVTLPLRLVSEANARGSWHAGSARALAARAACALAYLRDPSALFVDPPEDWASSAPVYEGATTSYLNEDAA